MAILLSKLIEKVHSNTKTRVSKTRKRFNPILREAIRSETGLVLNRKSRGSDYPYDDNSNISVPVSLKPGLPESLRNLTLEGDDLQLKLAISPYYRELKKLHEASKELGPMVENIKHHPIMRDKDKVFQRASELADSLLQKLEADNPVNKILAVHEDVLGCYRYKFNRHRDPFDGQIELFWGVIGLVAGMIGVEIEALTVVVLAHEVAHAYSHLGADIDGERWASAVFAECDTHLKEGIAQYYTYLICKKLEYNQPEILDTFKTLLKHQPPLYHGHEAMEKHSPEEVRLALLNIRRGQRRSFVEFLNILNQPQKGLIKNSHSRN